MSAAKGRVSSAIARPARTGVQTGAGFITAQLLDTFINLSDEQVLLIALLLTPVYSFVQTAIENHLGAGLLRSVPPKTEPIIDTPEPQVPAPRGEEGWVDPRLTVVIAVVALVLAIIAVLGDNVVIR